MRDRPPSFTAFAAIASILAACAPAAVAPVAPAPSCWGTTAAPPASSVPAAPVVPVASATETPPSLAPSPEPVTRPSSPTPALRDALDAAARAIVAGDSAAADTQIAAAQTAAGDDPHFVYMVARMRATRFASAADFDRAGAALVAVIPTLARHPELPDEFWAHNAMMMIREAQGDPAAALAEDDQATLCAARGTWDPQNRETLAFQKDRWHRAYLTRMLAQTRTGSAKQALVQYAQRALDEYRTRGFPDSVAILDAYFAALDGRRQDALAAAKRVDPAKDDDVEDLYLVVVGLEAGGDHAGAEGVRRAMRATQGAHIARAIMLRWLDIDAKPNQAGAFTPWHVTAR